MLLIQSFVPGPQESDIPSLVYSSGICAAVFGLCFVGMLIWSVRHWSHRRRIGLRPTWYGWCLLMLSVLAIGGYVWAGIAMYRSMPSNVEVFERYVGIRASPDVEIVFVELEGLGDYLSLQVCFEASQETIDGLLRTRSLQPNSGPPPTNVCVGPNADHYARSSGAGTGSGNLETVNGFHGSEQMLAYDPHATRAFYTFVGID